MSRPVTATIHTDAMRHNLASIRARTPSSRVMAMVKADAYGHGLETAASALREADAFGVASIAEARRLRALALAQPIMVLSGFASPSALDPLRELEADRIVHHAAPLEILEQSHGPPTRTRLTIHTGSHRLGVPTNQPHHDP